MHVNRFVMFRAAALSIALFHARESKWCGNSNGFVAVDSVHLMLSYQQCQSPDDCIEFDVYW